jgi:hypothetical protein
VLIVLGYDATTLAGQTGRYALERGWGYSAISQISFRIGGSSQYFLSGQQLLERNMRLVRTATQRNSLLSLGGQQCYTAADFAQTQYAYIPVSIWACPGEDELGLPLPTDLLSQQCQITCTLNPSSAFWIDYNTTGATWNGTASAPVPTNFDTAYFQIEQIQMDDRGMALANRVDMANHMYSMPLPTFEQTQFTLNIPAGASTKQQLVASGFRAGEVKKLVIWLHDRADVANPLLWKAPLEANLLYACQYYPQYQHGTAQIWNLLDGTAPAAVEQSQLNPGTGASVWSAPTSVLSYWTELPFSQPQGSDYEADVLVHGKQITNGIVNLEITPPYASAVGWDVNVSYVYNCTLGFSKGSADLIF